MPLVPPAGALLTIALHATAANTVDPVAERGAPCASRVIAEQAGAGFVILDKDAATPAAVPSSAVAVGGAVRIDQALLVRASSPVERVQR